MSIQSTTDSSPKVARANYHQSFNLKVVENGVIIECHGQQYQTFVFTTLDKAFVFIINNSK